MNNKNIKYNDFRYIYKLNNGSLANALKGKKISFEYAQKMADILEVKVEQICFIESSTKLYSTHYIDKIKRATRRIFAMAKRQLLVEQNYASADFVSNDRRSKKLYVTLTTNKPNNF